MPIPEIDKVNTVRGNNITKGEHKVKAQLLLDHIVFLDVEWIRT